MYFLILLAPAIVLALFAATSILCLMGHWAISVMVLVLTLLFNWYTESIAFNIKRKQKSLDGSEQIKILTYNLNRAYSTSVNNGSDSDVVNLISDQNADIVLLQEFNPLIYPEISEALRKIYPFGIQDAEGSRFKSVYSKYPVSSFHQLSTGTEILPICSMTINVVGHQLRVINCHLMSNNFSVIYRGIKTGQISLLSGIWKVFQAIDEGYKLRQQQAKILIDYLKASAEPVVVCGDFNEVSGSSVLRLFRKTGYLDAWWNSGCGLGFTYWGMKMRFRLDHILYNNDGFVPSKIDVVKSNISDHRLLIATFVYV